MATFMTEDFLLKNDIARTLYHKYAAPMPIYDFHCHLSPQEIADDRRFDNLGQIWLEGDHYKWRALRSAGVDESLITGKETSDYEKYMAWANTVPKTLGNRCITGRTLNYAVHLALQVRCSDRIPRKVSGRSVMRNWRRRPFPRAVLCSR